MYFKNKFCLRLWSLIVSLIFACYVNVGMQKKNKNKKKLLWIERRIYAVAWMARCTSGCQSRSFRGNLQMQGALVDVRTGWSWLCRELSDVVRGFSPGFPSSSSHLWSSGLITRMSLSCASVRFHCWPFMPFNSLMVLVYMKQGSLMFIPQWFASLLYFC